MSDPTESSEGEALDGFSDATMIRVSVGWLRAELARSRADERTRILEAARKKGWGLRDETPWDAALEELFDEMGTEQQG